MKTVKPVKAMKARTMWAVCDSSGFPHDICFFKDSINVAKLAEGDHVVPVRVTPIKRAKGRTRT